MHDDVQDIHENMWLPLHVRCAADDAPYYSQQTKNKTKERKNHKIQL
jgi:hypothetical protein